MTVRSKWLGRYESTASTTATLYTCPSGMTAIIKTVTVHTAAAVTPSIKAKHSGTNYPFFTYVGGIDTIGTWTGWIVISEGDTIEMARGNSGNNMQIAVYGTELAGVAP